MEETGLTVDAGELVFSGEYEPKSCHYCYGDAHHIGFFFRCYLNTDVPPQAPSETDTDPDDPTIKTEAKWIPLSELGKINIVPKISDPLTKYFQTGVFTPTFWAENEHLSVENFQ